MTKKTDERLGAVNEKLSPLQVTRHAVELLRRLTASAANESLRPTESEMEACASAVWRLPEHYRRWHIEVFDKARELLITATQLPTVALLAADHVERSAREMAALGVARAATGDTPQLNDALTRGASIDRGRSAEIEQAREKNRRHRVVVPTTVLFDALEARVTRGQRKIFDEGAVLIVIE